LSLVDYDGFGCVPGLPLLPGLTPPARHLRFGIHNSTPKVRKKIPVLELIDFGQKLWRFKAVARLNLKLGGGEMFGVHRGPGAGKSTPSASGDLLKRARAKGSQWP